MKTSLDIEAPLQKRDIVCPRGTKSRRVAYVENLGCAANRADGNRLQRALESHGWEIGTSVGRAQLVIVLTCGFTDHAESINRLRLRELAQEIGPSARMLIGGCLPAITGEPLNLPAHFGTFGPQDVDGIISAIEAEERTLPPSTASRTTKKLGPKPYMIRVSTGCRSRCTFCAIPRAAGQTKSRSVADIVSEISDACATGQYWIRLVSEDVSAYGLDADTNYVELVKEVLRRTRVQQLTLDTLNPRWLRQRVHETAELLSDRRLDRRIYVPVQSGSTRVLRRMARGYTRKDVEMVLTHLLDSVGDLQVSTDFLVGFPGEEEVDFQASRHLLRGYPFRFVEVFAFAARTGTPAQSFVDSMNESVRRQRAKILIADFLEMQMEAEAIESEAGLLDFLNQRSRLGINTNISLQG